MIHHAVDTFHIHIAVEPIKKVCGNDLTFKNFHFLGNSISDKESGSKCNNCVKFRENGKDKSFTCYVVA